jgi:hypothetical protein
VGDEYSPLVIAIGSGSANASKCGNSCLPKLGLYKSSAVTPAQALSSETLSSKQAFA